MKRGRGALEFFKKYDFSFFALSLAIFVIGVINLYSATHANPQNPHANLYKTQMMWYLLSLGVGGVVSLIRPKNYFRFSYFFYGVNILLLILVLVLGHQGMGARRWLLLGPIRIQPSEIMKISLVLILARWYARNDPDRPLGLKQLVMPFLLTIIPVVLIAAEPDLGTGLLALLVFFIISFMRQLRWKSILIIGVIGAISGSLMYQFGLKDYQKRRIKTFLNPSQDLRGSGYNAIQSKIAIGSGQLLGKGFKKSSQASLSYLPENHTDFVFSIFNEEHGFVGAIFLIGLYIVLFFRFLWLPNSVSRIFDAIVVVGIMSIFYLHTFINMGMVTGIMPIVGLPLPLMSYGGSSLMTFGICCGMATAISNSRNFF